MPRPRLLITTVLCLASLASAPVQARMPPPPDKNPSAIVAGHYVLDKRHASLTVRVQHMGYSWFTLRFDKLDGTLDFPAGGPTGARLDVTVDAASLNTGLEDLDAEVADEVLDTLSNPQMRFQSRSIEKTGPDTGRVTGDLTFRGVTKPLVLDVVYNGTAQAFGHDRVGFSATGTFKRSDFGADALSDYAGDDIRLLIEAEFSK